MLLPNRIIFPAIIIALAQLLLFIVLDLPFHTYLGPIIGAVIFGGIFWILANIAKGKLMGGGDVKLVFLMGLILGIQKLLLALFISFNAAALIGIILIILGKKKRTGYIPFGPFLILGTIIAYLWGRIIIEFYLNLTIK
jgi:prepilin signal peptidase PulO-like enzyme (type II secretory pathway)